MTFRLSLLLAVLLARPCLAQNAPPMHDVRVAGGISCQLPVNWMVDSRPVEDLAATEASRPGVLFQAHSMMMLGPSRNGQTPSLTISRWPATGTSAFADTARDPLDMPETFPVRQALALEGFTISKAWAAVSEQGGTQVVASTFLGAYGQTWPWIVETTTWRTQNTVFAVQLRYPEQSNPSGQKLLADIKSGVRFNGQAGVSFASGYKPAEPGSTAAARPPFGDFPGTSQNLTVASLPPQIPGVAPSVAPSLPTVPQAELANILRRVNGSLVLVEGKEKSGSGFVCNLGGQKYLVTNTHVISGNSGVTMRPLDRAAIQFGAASTAVAHDLTRMIVTSANPALDLLDNLNTNLSVGDDVLVLGNAEGAQVVNTIAGHVVGIGPDLVEVDAPFVPGNSGSPIIQVKSGKVVGVATYAITREMQSLADGRKEKKIRRFGYRLDSVAAWQPVNWTKFNAEAAAVRQAEELTVDLAHLWKGIADGSGHYEMARNAGLRQAEDRFEQDTQTSNHASTADILHAKQSFLTTVRGFCTNDLAGLRPTLTYDYFQRAAADEQEIRNQFFKAFDELLKVQKEDRRNGSNTH